MSTRDGRVGRYQALGTKYGRAHKAGREKRHTQGGNNRAQPQPHGARARCPLCARTGAACRALRPRQPPPGGGFLADGAPTRHRLAGGGGWGRESTK